MQTMASESVTDLSLQEIKEANRAKLDEIAPKFGIVPTDYPKVDDLRAAIVEAYGRDSEQAGTDDDRTDEIEELKAQLEALQSLLSQVSQTTELEVSFDDEDPPSIEPVIHPATQAAPWITVDLTGEA